MVQCHGWDYDWRSQPIDPQAAYASAGGQAHGRWEYLIWISKLFSYACDWTESMVYSTKSMVYYTKCMVHSCRLGIFDSMIDSRELRRRGRQSTSSSSQSSHSRSFTQEIEIAVLCQQAYYHQSVLRQQMQYQRQQPEYQQKKDEYYSNLQSQNQALLSVSWSNILFVTTKNTWCVPCFLNNWFYLICSNWHNKRASRCQHMGCRLWTLHCRRQWCRLHLRHNSLWYVHICVCDMFIDALCVKMKNLVVNISCACVIGLWDISRFSCRTWRCVCSRWRIDFLGEQHFQHPESSRRKWL
jgi:hypothetical protein